MTQLDPLTEHLFQAWARAHGVQDHDDPNNQFDHRGLYKATNGMIMNPKHVQDMAAAHNAAANKKDSGSNVEFPDPYAAQAEVHKANLDAHTKSQANQAKMTLEREKMHHKLMIEQMKLHHKSQEAEKERAHKGQLEGQKHQLSMVQHHMDRQAAVQDAQVQRANQIQDAQTNRQAQVEDAVRQEHFARTRPQPEPKTTAPTSHGPQTPTQPQVMSQPSPLAQQLMRRSVGAGPTN